MTPSPRPARAAARGIRRPTAMESARDAVAELNERAAVAAALRQIGVAPAWAKCYRDLGQVDWSDRYPLTRLYRACDPDNPGDAAGRRNCPQGNCAGIPVGDVFREPRGRPDWRWQCAGHHRLEYDIAAGRISVDPHALAVCADRAVSGPYAGRQEAVVALIRHCAAQLLDRPLSTRPAASPGNGHPARCRPAG